MAARFRSWWLKTRKSINVLGLIAVLVVVAALIFIEVRVYGTGFKGKTLWDWLQLLIVPVVLAIGGYLFTYTISRNERKAADRHNETEREIALDNQREAALQEYIDKMSELLLHEKLREAAELDEIVTIAQVRTLTVLPRLDAKLKKSLLQFLFDARLIYINRHIIDLGSADLSFADLNNAVLSNIDLSGANLVGAMLDFSNLTFADLSRASLYRANLFGAVLRRGGLTAL
jgi:pentapeptide repeat protein